MFIKRILPIITIFIVTNNINKAKNTKYYTDNGFCICHENYQVKGGKYFELCGNKIETKGLTILWSNNIQISSKRAIVEMNKDNRIKTISLLKSTENKKEYKPLIIMFTKQGYPNHFSADKIVIFFNTERNKIEKISMEENVDSFYFITTEEKAKCISKGKFKKLEPFYDEEEKTWNVNINCAKGEIVSIQYAEKIWDNFVLENFKIYDNEIIRRKKDLTLEKEKCILKINEEIKNTLFSKTL